MVILTRPPFRVPSGRLFPFYEEPSGVDAGMGSWRLPDAVGRRHLADVEAPYKFTLNEDGAFPNASLFSYINACSTGGWYRIEIICFDYLEAGELSADDIRNLKILRQALCMEGVLTPPFPLSTHFYLAMVLFPGKHLIIE